MTNITNSATQMSLDCGVDPTKPCGPAELNKFGTTTNINLHVYDFKFLML